MKKKKNTDGDLVFKPYALKTSSLFLTGDIDDKMTEKVGRFLSAVSDEINTVDVYVDSFGGTTGSARSICYLLKSSGKKIRTIGLSNVISAGITIFLSGEERIATPETHFMFHEIQIELSGSMSRTKKDIETYKREEDWYLQWIVKNTSLTMKELKKILESDEEYFFDIEEAREYGMVDGVLQMKGVK